MLTFEQVFCDSDDEMPCKRARVEEKQTPATTGMEDVTVLRAHDAGLLYIPAEVKDEVLEWYGSTTIKQLKTLAQPFLSESIRVLFGNLTVIEQFVYLMRDCRGDMHWSDFYGHNEFRACCLNAHKMKLLTVFNLIQSAVRTCAPHNEHFWYAVQSDEVVQK